MPIDIAHEVQRDVAVAIGVERRHHHLRAQIAAADADVDDMADAAGRRIAHTLGIGQHGIQHAVHLIAELALPARCAQRRVQHGAAFRGIDGLAGKHRIAARFEAALTRQLEQELQARAV